MIDLAIRSIFENTKKIENVATYATKINKRTFTGIAILAGCCYALVEVVKNQEERIQRLETIIKEMKSKGE